ncbi:endospore germination permease [Brevibacillus choshinensis]|uniref:GerAB/ArcD/ProY family transporter n=1 Tax=Brevibacillus choshinensis TaxID=54911 RepID=UPI002E21C0C3|nr:endospore germination permease [Brevibacillus choshinensis]MED4753493.1 endospore germination permease [Brevibacillus choshinensis]
MTTVKITVRQMMIITMLFTIGTTILVAPSTMASASGQDAWISASLGTGAGLGLGWLYTSLGLLYPANNLLEINELVLGKWLGKFVSILFVFTMFLFSSQVLYYIGNFLATHFFPETPIQFLILLFLIIPIVAMRVGIEPFARAVELFFPWFLLLFFCLVMFVLPKAEFVNIQPVLEANGKELFKGALWFVSITYLTAPTLLMFFPVCVNRPIPFKKGFLMGGLLGGLMLILIILLSILVLSAKVTILYNYPSFILGRQINIGNFLQRLEAIVAILWFLTIFVKLTMYNFAAVFGLAQLCRLRTYRPLIMPSGILIATFSLIVYPNFAYQQTWDAGTWLPYSLLFGLLYPLCLLIIGSIRKKQGRTES